jgi:predicted porin
MNKKLIAVALAALPVAAMADVTLYGTLNGGLEHDTATNQASNSGVHDYTSIVGFKGNEDLGNGLKTVWQVENRVNIGGNSGSSTAFGSRQTFVGLDGGNLGKVRMGYLNSALKDAQTLDQWNYDGEIAAGGASTGVNGLAILTNTGNRLKNAIRYDSASFAGFDANLEYGFGENKNKAGNIQDASDVIGLGLNYTISDFAFHYAYQKEKNTGNMSTNTVVQTGNAKSASINYFGADYSANNLYLGLAYQAMTGYDWADYFASSTAVASNLKTRQLAATVAYTIGAFTPKASYVKGWDQKNGNTTLDNTGYKQYVLGVSYALSKRTTAEFNYGHVTVGKNSTLSTAGSTSDNTISTVALSMAHSF